MRRRRVKKPLKGKTDSLIIVSDSNYMRRKSHTLDCNRRKPKYNSYYRSSYKERRVNALAPGAEEGRGKLRKAAVRRKQPSTRRYPNGETHLR